MGIQYMYDRDRSLDVENAIKKAAEDDGFVTYQVTKRVISNIDRLVEF